MGAVVRCTRGVLRLIDTFADICTIKLGGEAAGENQPAIKNVAAYARCIWAGGLFSPAIEA
jgi:hypothetical protein